MDTLVTAKPGGVLQIVLTTTAFAKFILLILLVFSIISWAIIIRKWLFFRAVERANRSYSSLFQHRPNLVQFAQSGLQFLASGLPLILEAALLEWKRLTDPDTGITPAAAGSESVLPVITEAMKRQTSRTVEGYERSLSFLATAGSASPFLGLLGTVWGIMKSFMDIRALPTVTLQTVAPGIADALIVTAAGLLVAVPAVIFYNYFIGRIREFEAAMERFSSEVASDLRKQWLRLG
jgi:biopolymer transport protein TolQ